MHTAPLQRAWCNFSRNTSYFVWILSLQKHTALPQRKITLIQKDMFVLNTAFVGRYGDVVITVCWSHLAYSAEIVFCWRDNVVAFIQEWTPGHFFKKYMLSSGNERSFICSLSFNVITVLKQQQGKCTPTASCSLSLYFFFLSLFIYLDIFKLIHFHRVNLFCQCFFDVRRAPLHNSIRQFWASVCIYVSVSACPVLM